MKLERAKTTPDRRHAPAPGASIHAEMQIEAMAPLKAFPESKPLTDSELEEKKREAEEVAKRLKA